MTDSNALQLPVDLQAAFARLYWLFPFQTPTGAPLPPRKAPRRTMLRMGARTGHEYPDWVIALWCCKVHLGALSEQNANTLGTYLHEVNQSAHAAGAPESVVFFAGSLSLWPGTTSYSAAGKEFIKGSIRDFVYGFEPEAHGAPQLVRYLHTAKDPERRLERLDLRTWLEEKARDSELYDTDSDVFSKETYASILATRAAPRPEFALRWDRTREEAEALIAATPVDEPAQGPPAPRKLPYRVRHPKFGVGTVTARTGSGDSEKLTIEFADGKKVLLARFVSPEDP